jgi:serine/threonine protein kinase
VLHAGTRLNHYRIGRPLGAGGMGEAYEAEDLSLERTVALKVLPPELAADPARAARFEREARASPRSNTRISSLFTPSRNPATRSF